MAGGSYITRRGRERPASTAGVERVNCCIISSGADMAPPSYPSEGEATGTPECLRGLFSYGHVGSHWDPGEQLVPSWMIFVRVGVATPFGQQTLYSR